MKWLFPLMLILALGGVLGHYLWKRQNQRDEEERERIAAQSRLDLSHMPEPVSRPVEEPKPKRASGNKPVIIELSMKTRGGALSSPFRVLNAAGETVSADEAPPPGEPVTLILSPGEYQLQIPAKKFKHSFSVASHDGERKTVSVTVPGGR